MRICSFLPSATEILYALGLGDSVAGVTFECDYPPEAREKPVLVNSSLSHETDAASIDQQVSAAAARGESLYRIDAQALKGIEPDIIVTQELCHVCAVTPGELGSALTNLSRSPHMISLHSHKLEGVWQDIMTVAEATDRRAAGEALLKEIEGRLAAVDQAVGAVTERPRVLCIEWLDPPFIAGHWVPEMVSLAGGTDVVGQPGERSVRSTWEELLETKPDVIVVMPCGYGLEQTVKEFRSTRLPGSWKSMPAVHKGQVYAVDANSYFSRPAPRLATGVEILAHLLHPDLAPKPIPYSAFAPLT